MSRKSRKRGKRRRKKPASRPSYASSKSKIQDPVLPSDEDAPRRGNVSDRDFQTAAEVLKVDEDLGLVIGWAIVSKVDDEPYFDLQGDHITEKAMLEAATDFMLHSRMAAEMHKNEDGDEEVEKAEERGSVVFAWPMTTEIAEAFGIVTKQTGLMVAMKPDAEMLKRFRDGELTGFSIGGTRGEDEVVAS